MELESFADPQCIFVWQGQNERHRSVPAIAVGTLADVLDDIAGVFEPGC